MIKEIKNLKNPFGDSFGNWKRAIIEYKKKDYKVTYKKFDEGSVYGIDGGKISKLSISVDGKEVCNYDRGWDVKPTDEGSKAVLSEVLDNENK